MSRHTPGPWKWELCEDGFFVLLGADGFAVLAEGDALEPNTPQNKANFDLIAAAPMMAKALQMVNGYLRAANLSAEAGDMIYTVIEALREAGVEDMQ